MSPRAAHSLLLALLLGCAGLGRAAEVEWSVEPLGCDSLVVNAGAPGWSWLEGDLGTGFQTLAWPDPGGRALLRLPAPPPGVSLALRAARLDSLSLPEFSDEWIWSRSLPKVEARLEGQRLTGRVRDAGPDGCPPPELILRLERHGHVTDLQRLGAGSTFQLDLAGREFDALTLGWGGLGESLRLSASTPGGEEARQPESVPAEDFAAPLLLGFDGESLRLQSSLQLVLLQGRAELSPGPPGEWRLRPLGGGEILVAGASAAGEPLTLPFRWESGAGKASLRVERLGAGRLRVLADPSLGPLELVWLDGQGRQGRQALLASLELDGLAGSCRLQALGAEGPLWRQELDLSWSPPVDLRLGSQADTLLLAELVDPRGWSEVWELEWREGGTTRRLPAAPRHQLRLPDDQSLHLRWRAGSPPSQSRWSPWRVLSLTPQPPEGVVARPEAGGVLLAWEPREWLSQDVEVERVLDGDTLRVTVPASAGRWLDLPPGDRLARYRLRSRLTRRLSEWSPALWCARPLRPGEGAGPARTRVSVAEWRAFGRESGVPLPAPAEWVEGRGGLPRDDQPVLGISPREALLFCNWLNERMGVDGRYDEGGTWRAGGQGGCRLPEDPRSLTGSGRVWLMGEAGVRVAGVSELRAGSTRRPYSLDARQPDVGLSLEWASPVR